MDNKLTTLLLSIFLSCAFASAQDTKAITGKVLDSNDEPIIGAAVYKSLTNGQKTPAVATVTDINGVYRIIVPANSTSITIESMGYETQIIEIKGRQKIDVVLKEEANAIDALVVTGIYTRKAESFTGAVQTINSSQLQQVSNQNAFEALKNLDPSLMVLTNLDQGSNPNATASLQLRGASSFSVGDSNLKSNFVDDPNMPLFILDGFETTAEKIMDMDMNRIESITILKDASAKAIYGSKAGNGVIVIETKALRTNETLVTYSGNFTLEMPDLTSYNLCNSLEKLEIEQREHYYETSNDTIYWLELQDLYNSRLKRALEGESTYWLSKPIQTSFSHQHSVTVEIGSKNLKTTTTFAYNNTQGVMKGSDRQTISGSMNLSYRRDKWLFRNIMDIGHMKSNNSPYGSFSTYASLNPYDNPYTEDGQLKRTMEAIGGNSIGNPLYDATLSSIDSSQYLDFTDNFYAEFSIFDFLKLVGRVGVTTKNTKIDEFFPASHSKFLSLTLASDEQLKLKAGTYDLTNGSSTSFSGDISAQLNKNFNDAHDLFATMQYSISENQYDEVSQYTQGFPNSRMTNIIFARQYTEGSTPTGSNNITRNIGVLGTAGYSYKDKYMLDATLRANASSSFGTNNRWALFWSVGTAWNIHKEPFFSGVKWLDQFKLRASMGSSGNQNYTSNATLALYQYYNDGFYNGFTGARLANMENPNLGWEQKMESNVGLDLRTKHFSVVADAYIADTENLVFTRSLLPSTGFKSYSDNLGKVRNKGVELSLSYRVFSNNNGFLNFNVRGAYNDNRILEISDALREYNQEQQDQATANGTTTPVIQYFDGCAMNAIWAVPSLGIDPASGKEIFLDKEGNKTNVWKASNLEYCGSKDPLVNGNFGFNLEMYHVGINAVCRYYFGGYRYNTTLVNRVENVDIANNLDRRIYSDRWYQAGQVAMFRNGILNPTQATTRFVQRDNVLEISSISLYYDFPVKLVSKLGMERLRLSAYLNDLYTFSSIQIERGTDYPYARSLSFSVIATF